jgi:hypothetical protein
MKNIIRILVLLFITTSVFGQSFIRSHSFIESTPTGNITIEDALHDGDNGNFDWIRYVHFVKDGWLYLLSYEPKEDHLSGGDRKIYLYKKKIENLNSPWENACADVSLLNPDYVNGRYISNDTILVPKAVKMNSWHDGDNYQDVDFFRKELSFGSSGEVIFEGDNVKITIRYSEIVNGVPIFSIPLSFLFEPIENGLYRIYTFRNNRI